jgi:hypothetical protein
MKPTIAFEAIVIWFGASIAIHILSGIALELWLRLHGVRMYWFWVGIPGYLERLYREWAIGQGRSGRWLTNLRLLSVINVIASAAVAIPLMVASHAHALKLCDYGGSSAIHECSGVGGTKEVSP